MLNSKPLNKLLFLDVETVPQHASFYDMSPTMQELFLKKFKKDAEELIGLPMDLWDVPALNTEEWKPKLELFYNNRGALHAEFLKIVCISVGKFKTEIPLNLADLNPDTPLEFTTKSFYGEEHDILKTFHAEFKSVLDSPVNPSHHLTSYNGFMFDWPVMAKRFIINRLPLPALLDMDGKKEWNLPYLVDPRVSWRMTSFDGGISLALLCEVLGVKSPKDGEDGSMVRDIYYVDKDLKRISDYCIKDVVSLGECYLRMKGVYNKVVPV